MLTPPLPLRPMRKAKPRGRTDETAELTREEQASVLAVLHRLYVENDENAAAVGRVLKMSGPAITQLLGEVNRPGLKTARAIARFLRVSPWQVIDPMLERKGGTLVTASSHPHAALALRQAAERWQWPSWVTEHLSHVPIPEHWAPVSPGFYADLAHIWTKYDVEYGSGERLKSQPNQ